MGQREEAGKLGSWETGKLGNWEAGMRKSESHISSKLKAVGSKIGKVYLPFLPNQLINELTNQPGQV
jgi:hypothetical protein